MEIEITPPERNDLKADALEELSKKFPVLRSDKKRGIRCVETALQYFEEQGDGAMREALVDYLVKQASHVYGQSGSEGPDAYLG